MKLTKSISILVLGVLMLLVLVDGLDESKGYSETNHRKGKLFSLFQIVSFPNSPCSGGGTKNGTCYTAAECTAKGGSNSGSCASGYGVCCTFTIGCAARSSENCTYFDSTTVNAGECRATICPCNNNICQLRLDFVNFQITGPSTSTDQVGLAVGGELAGVNADAQPVSIATRCLTDTFSVTNGDGTNPPVICGSNTGDHMYVDTDRTGGCNTLAFTLSNNAIGTSVPMSRGWSIKVSQYDCDYVNLAPSGCTQYYFGSNSQSVQSFNYDGDIHLANQDQNICVRRERGNCRICWNAENAQDFEVSGPVDAAMMASMNKGYNLGATCCDYGASGLKTFGYDCVVIPGAMTNLQMNQASDPTLAPVFCGRSNGLVITKASEGAALATKMSKVNQVVCSTRTPFELRFITDPYEFTNTDTPAMGEAFAKDKGFRLTYTMDANC